MKKFTYIIGIISCFVVACDKIEGPYREISSEGIVIIDDASLTIDGDTFSFPVDQSVPEKKVLIEDFTGILCGNCPYAGLKLNDTIKPVFGEKLVVVSVHAGFFAIPCPSTQGACPGDQPAGAFLSDYRTPAGEEWDLFFGNSNGGNPNGLIDRMDYPTSQHVKYPSTWQAKIQERSQLPAPFAIRLQKDYDPVTRELRVAVQTRAVNAIQGDYKLQVILTEDSIIDWQEWYPPVTPEFDPDYIHRHMFRHTFNTTFGQQFASGSVGAGEKYINGYKLTLNSAWNADHCKVVAYVYKADTYEVLQVEEL